ncbi:MAG TPA: helix-turn-helix transcriptional regulator [Actinomycetales bacterium]|nr:helix-turn-helix transcriptional regulator [Actinomycetales bacterium]
MRPAPANRGPAAAAENRAAILSAARRLFRERGYRIPFSAIARAAGVGQAVMYRHFPSKLDVALAVFEENLTELEVLAAEPRPDAFWRAWDRLVDMTIESLAFVEMAVEARQSLPDYTGTTRLEALLASALARAQEAGAAPDGLTAMDVILTERMVYGIVASSTPADARQNVDQALALVTWTASRPR